VHYVVLLSAEGSGRFYVDADSGEARTKAQALLDDNA
jgi:hypothetical protein